MKAYFTDIKIILLIGAILLALLPLLYNIKSLKTPKLLPEAEKVVPKQKIDLTLGKIENFANYPIPFVEQKEAVCNQQNLQTAFGQTINPEKIKPLRFDSLPSLYGETNWWYVLGGEVTSIQPKGEAVNYTIENGNTALKVSVFPGKTSIGINPGPKDAKKISADSLSLGDNVTFYTTVKCEGGKPPYLTVQMVYSDDFIKRIK